MKTKSCFRCGCRPATTKNDFHPDLDFAWMRDVCSTCDKELNQLIKKRYEAYFKEFIKITMGRSIK